MSLTPPPANFENELRRHVGMAIEESLAKIVEEEAEKAVENVERRFRERIGQIATRVSASVHYQFFSTELRIVCQFPEKKNPLTSLHE